MNCDGELFMNFSSWTNNASILLTFHELFMNFMNVHEQFIKSWTTFHRGCYTDLSFPPAFMFQHAIELLSFQTISCGDYTSNWIFLYLSCEHSEVNLCLGYPNEVNLSLGYPNEVNLCLGYPNEVNLSLGYPNEVNLCLGYPNEVNLLPMKESTPNEVNLCPNGICQWGESTLWGESTPNEVSLCLGYPNEVNISLGYPNEVNLSLGYLNEWDLFLEHPNDRYFLSQWGKFVSINLVLKMGYLCDPEWSFKT